MKGYVNKDLCIGCGMCCGIAPDAFRMGEDGRAEGYAEIKADGEDELNQAVPALSAANIRSDGRP